MFRSRKKKLDQENLINLLSEKPEILTCEQCEHYHNPFFGNEKCLRNRTEDRNMVTGKNEVMGEILWPFIERETKANYNILFSSGLLCGYSGQFWKRKVEVKRWWQVWK